MSSENLLGKLDELLKELPSVENFDRDFEVHGLQYAVQLDEMRKVIINF